MKATLKTIAALALVALSTGCASLSLEGDGNGAQASRPDFILSQMDQDSRGK